MNLRMEEVALEEWGENSLGKTDVAIVLTDDQLNDSFDLIEAKDVIRIMENACDKALTLRGLVAAINDPLALEGEKQEFRSRYKQIETEIRAAVGKARAFRRKNK